MCKVSGMLSSRAEAQCSLCISATLCPGLKGKVTYLCRLMQSVLRRKDHFRCAAPTICTPDQQMGKFCAPRASKAGRLSPLLQGAMQAAALSLHVTCNCLITLTQGWRGGIGGGPRRDSEDRGQGAKTDKYGKTIVKPDTLYAN